MKTIFHIASIIFVSAMTISTTFAQDVVPAQDQSWTKYTNSRFGVQADIPTNGFFRQPPPVNGDGITLLDANATVDIRVYGSFWTGSNNSFAEYRAQEIQHLKDEGAEVTYAASGTDWFVLTGFRDETIFYHKALAHNTCGIVGHIYFTYPATMQSDLGPIVERMENSLRLTSSVEC